MDVPPEVIGYAGSDVTLHCQLISPQSCNISQVQWDFLQPDGNKTIIFVFHNMYGKNVPESYLKRLDIERQSLIIRHVELADAGLYTCTLATFPCGSVEGTTKLVVHEMKPSSAGIIPVIVIAVLLLLVIVAAIVYRIYIRRREAVVSLRVLIDTSGPVAAATRPSFIVKEKEVVYSDIKPKKPVDAPLSSRRQHGDPEQADDVTYAEVIVMHPKPK